MKRYKFLSAALLGALLTMGTVTSCSDSGYLDINYNPDYPTTATYKQLFPSAEASTVAVLGLYGQLTGNSGVSMPHRVIVQTSIIHWLTMR